MAADNIVEKIPEFTRRMGDQVIQGSNNTTIILGTDRIKDGPATLDDGEKGSGAGAISIIAGRKGENPDINNDAVTFYLGMKSDADGVLKSKTIGTDSGKSAVAIIKTDNVRIVGRKNIKVFIDDKSWFLLDKDKCLLNVNGSTFTLTKDGTLAVDCKKIELGKNASIGSTLTDMITQKINERFEIVKNHVHPVPAFGSSGTSPELASMQQINVSEVSSKRTFIDKG